MSNNNTGATTMDKTIKGEMMSNEKRNEAIARKVKAEMEIQSRVAPIIKGVLRGLEGRESQPLLEVKSPRWAYQDLKVAQELLASRLTTIENANKIIKASNLEQTSQTGKVGNINITGLV